MQQSFLHIFTVIFIVSLYPLTAFSDDTLDVDKALHFDQSQGALKSLNFKHDNELRPTINDFRIIQTAYLSNNIGERWAIVTFENKSTGKRFLKNESIVATFADGNQSYALNLDEMLKGNEHITKSVFFGIHQFPIVRVQVE